MGWRGSMRSMAAIARAVDRDAQRRYKIAIKNQMIADATEAVAQWEEYIDKLAHIRISDSPPFNWHRTANQPKPSQPIKRTTQEQLALLALDKFKPGFFDFLWGGSESRRRKLVSVLERAKLTDAQEYDEAKKQYKVAFTEWEADISLAERVLRGEPSAYKEVAEEFLSQNKDEFIGTSISISFSHDQIHAKPIVHGTEIVPAFQRKQTTTGKLSETKMPISRCNELYQDYVAGVAFQVASDFFSILPVDEIFVTCLANIVNTQSGYLEDTPILSVRFIRTTMEHLNLEQVDPSDALAKFQHAMRFKKLTGFSRVEPLKPLD